MTTTDGFYCINCKKDVVCDIEASVEDVLTISCFSVRVGIEVICQECRNTILILGGIVQ